MLAYAGNGYTEAFAANYDRVIERLNAGEDILIVAGPDDICEALLSEADCHCNNESVKRRDADAVAAVCALLGRQAGETTLLVLDADTLADLRDGFASGAIRKACGAYPDSGPCEWYALCSGIAADGFRAGKLRGPLDADTN